MPFGPHNSTNFPDLDYVNRWFESHIAPFLLDFGFAPNSEVRIDTMVAQDVLRCYFDDMDRYKQYSGIENPSVFKKMGHLAFWIRKLKPITNIEPIHPEFADKTNEIFALNLAMFYCDFASENPRLGYTPVLSTQLWHDLLYFFRYKSVSPHSLTMLLNAMYSAHFEAID